MNIFQAQLTHFLARRRSTRLLKLRCLNHNRLLSLILGMILMFSPWLAHGLEKVSLQLKWTHAFQFAGYYAASEKGYYSDVGLEVEIIESQPGSSTVDRVSSGEVQYGVGTNALLLEWHAGKPVVVLAVIFQHSPQVLVARQDHPGQTVHDLVGKQIMLEEQSDELVAYLIQAGIGDNQFTRVEHSFDVNDLLNGSTDAMSAYLTYELYYLNKQKFPYQIYSPRSHGIDFYGDNLFTSQQELDKHPARVKAFREASLRGWEYAMAHPEEIIDLIISTYSTGHDHDFFRFEVEKMVPLIQPKLVELGYMHPGRWRHIAETYADLGMLPEELELTEFLYDPAPAVDYSWAYKTLLVALSLLCLFVGLIIYVHRTNRQLDKFLANSKHAEQREIARNLVLEKLSRNEPLENILTAIVNNVEQQQPEMLCSILLLDARGEHFLIGAAPSLPDFYNNAIDGVTIGDNLGSCGTAAYRRERIIVENIATHPFWADSKALASQAQLASCWSDPIISPSGKLLGTFAIYHRQPATPSTKDIHLIEQVSSLVSIVIERSKSQEELRQASMVYENSSESMMIVDADNHILTINPAFTSINGYTPDEVIGQTPSMFKSGRHDDAFYQKMWASINTTGKWQGEIWNTSKNGEIHPQWLTINTIYNEDGNVHRRVALFSDISQQKAYEELIWNQANFDSLTELPNRRMFQDRLTQEINKTKRSGIPLALLLLDIDRFKDVNDALGHEMGDELLKELAARLRQCIRGSDTIARLGGDEFVIILSELTDTAGVERLCADILATIAEPVQLGIDNYHVSTSIGVTFYPQDASQVNTLLKNADQAMYAAKARGRNCFNYFTPALQEQAKERIRLANDLRGALERGELSLHYQPIVDLSSNDIHKAEALIRWHHPQRGMVSPLDFIHIAEETGMINDIGNWVFKEAASQAVHWRQTYHPNMQISVNTSPRQYQNGIAEWLNCLAELQLPGGAMIVEITENLLMESGTDISDKLAELRQGGLEVALDDFGTGYSSLAYIKKFDIDYVKIDQSFVRNLSQGSNDLTLCEAIITMAHKLGFKVVAEGIETQIQCDLLKAAGCDFGQGYLFSKPVPSMTFEELLNTPDH